MFYDIGYYFLFLFKCSLALILSLVVFSAYKPNKNIDKLRYYAMLMVIITGLFAVSSSYSHYNSDILLFTIIAVSMLLSVKILVAKPLDEDFLHYFLLFTISFLIGIGYYLSAVTFVVVVFLMKYLLDGVFTFFNKYDDEKTINDEQIIEQIDE